MKKIVTVIKPFTYTQNVFVYEDGNKIDVSSTSLDKIFETIVELTEKYKTNEVQLIGSSKFSKGIKKEIQEAEMNKYNKNELNIELINN